MSENSQPSLSGAENVRWNLKDLYASEEALLNDLQDAGQEAEEFESTYRNQVSQLDPISLKEALGLFEALQDRLDRAFTFAYLNWCVNTEESSRGALLQKVREEYLRVEQKLLFFELELIDLKPTQAGELIRHPEMGRYRHYLEILLLRKEHVLSEPEEKIMGEKSVTGGEAWNRFFDELLGGTRFQFRSQDLTEQEVLSRLHDPDREIRKDAADALTQGLKSRSRELTFIFNVTLADKAANDRLRHFPSWLSSRNLSNEISDEAVQTLISAVTSRYDLVSRFYQLKRQLLGLDELFDYDRYAPVGGVERSRSYSWDAARELVLDSYFSFDEQAGKIASDFFEHRWIHATVEPGKRSGAFSHRGVPEVHPYILLNFTGNQRDVQTLAHELGHGIHQYLSREQGSLQARPPLTTSETASVFGEMLVFEKLMQIEKDPSAQLSMLVTKIDDTLATVFRQVAMNQFEDRIHTARREVGELSPEQFGEYWLETQNQMFQGSVTLLEHYRHWWSYIPHFVHTPGYVYAYAFGELLVLALYSLYLEDKETFPGRYMKLLEAGGSDWPYVLVGRLGVDLRDPDFWKQGLNSIENLIQRAEQLASETVDERALSQQ